VKKSRIRSTALAVLLLLLIPCVLAVADVDEGDQFVYRTTDKNLLEILEDSRNFGPEIIKSGQQEKAAGTRALLAFWLSQPTANMFDYDIKYYSIDIELFFSQYSIGSSVLIGIEALADDMNFIDLTFCQDLTIDAVLVDGQAATYLHNDQLFTVYLPEPVDSGEHVSIQVNYHGMPIFSGTPNSGVGGGLSFHSIHTSQICQTECEPFGSRNWFPCKDFPFDKADSVDLRITHPAGMTTCANGLLQSISDNGDGTKTTHWRSNYPITTYVIHFVTAYQNLWEQKWEYAPGDTMPVVVYAYDGFPESVNNYLTYTIPGLDVFSEIFGLYPFVEEKYGHSIYDEWGMENQTMTALYHTITNEWTIIHEMAHHWWGNLITCWNFHHIWLNEGFATYSEALYYEYLYGIDFYHDYIQSQSCMNLGSVYVEDLDNDYIFDGGTTYHKGSRVLHMLRHVVGDAAFFQIIQNYQSDPELRYGWAVTTDFQAHCEAVYGESLNWFFNEWIYQEGNPHYEYGWINWYDSSSQQDQLLITIRQTQSGEPHYYPLFQMPIDVQVYSGSGDTTYVVFNSSGKQTFILDLNAPADSVRLDPDNWILSTKSEGEFTMANMTATLDTAYLGQYFYKKFAAVGGVPPYTWAHVSGQYPYGTTFDPGDPPNVSGYPIYASQFSFQMRVYDSSNPPLADTVWFHVEVIESYMCGDVNDDETINVSDAVFVINYIFLGGDPPDPLESGDCNCDGKTNITDAVWIINHVFLGGKAPCDTDGNGQPDC
jgi:aminopeptidase N